MAKRPDYSNLPLVPYVDSNEEVFFGPVTAYERRRMERCNRIRKELNIVSPECVTIYSSEEEEDDDDDDSVDEIIVPRERHSSPIPRISVTPIRCNSYHGEPSTSIISINSSLMTNSGDLEEMSHSNISSDISSTAFDFDESLKEKRGDDFSETVDQSLPDIVNNCDSVISSSFTSAKQSFTSNCETEEEHISVKVIYDGSTSISQTVCSGATPTQKTVNKSNNISYISYTNDSSGVIPKHKAGNGSFNISYTNNSSGAIPKQKACNISYISNADEFSEATQKPKAENKNCNVSYISYTNDFSGDTSKQKAGNKSCNISYISNTDDSSGATPRQKAANKSKNISYISNTNDSFGAIPKQKTDKSCNINYISNTNDSYTFQSIDSSLLDTSDMKDKYESVYEHSEKSIQELFPREYTLASRHSLVNKNETSIFENTALENESSDSKLNNDIEIIQIVDCVDAEESKFDETTIKQSGKSDCNSIGLLEYSVDASVQSDTPNKTFEQFLHKVEIIKNLSMLEIVDSSEEDENLLNQNLSSFCENAENIDESGTSEEYISLKNVKNIDDVNNSTTTSYLDCDSSMYVNVSLAQHDVTYYKDETFHVPDESIQNLETYTFDNDKSEILNSSFTSSINISKQYNIVEEEHIIILREQDTDKNDTNNVEDTFVEESINNMFELNQSISENTSLNSNEKTSNIGETSNVSNIFGNQVSNLDENSDTNFHYSNVSYTPRWKRIKRNYYNYEQDENIGKKTYKENNDYENLPNQELDNYKLETHNLANGNVSLPSDSSSKKNNDLLENDNQSNNLDNKHIPAKDLNPHFEYISCNSIREENDNVQYEIKNADSSYREQLKNTLVHEQSSQFEVNTSMVTEDSFQCSEITNEDDNFIEAESNKEVLLNPTKNLPMSCEKVQFELNESEISNDSFHSTQITNEGDNIKEAKSDKEQPMKHTKNLSLSCKEILFQLKDSVVIEDSFHSSEIINEGDNIIEAEFNKEHALKYTKDLPLPCEDVLFEFNKSVVRNDSFHSSVITNEGDNIKEAESYKEQSLKHSNNLPLSCNEILFLLNDSVVIEDSFNSSEITNEDDNIIEAESNKEVLLKPTKNLTLSCEKIQYELNESEVSNDSFHSTQITNEGDNIKEAELKKEQLLKHTKNSPLSREKIHFEPNKSIVIEGSFHSCEIMNEGDNIIETVFNKEHPLKQTKDLSLSCEKVQSECSKSVVSNDSFHCCKITNEDDNIIEAESNKEVLLKPTKNLPLSCEKVQLQFNESEVSNDSFYSTQITNEGDNIKETELNKEQLLKHTKNSPLSREKIHFEPNESIVIEGSFHSCEITNEGDNIKEAELNKEQLLKHTKNSPFSREKIHFEPNESIVIEGSFHSCEIMNEGDNIIETVFNKEDPLKQTKDLSLSCEEVQFEFCKSLVCNDSFHYGEITNESDNIKEAESNNKQPLKHTNNSPMTCEKIQCVIDNSLNPNNYLIINDTMSDEDDKSIQDASLQSVDCIRNVYKSEEKNQFYKHKTLPVDVSTLLNNSTSSLGKINLQPETEKEHFVCLHQAKQLEDEHYQYDKSNHCNYPFTSEDGDAHDDKLQNKDISLLSSDIMIGVVNNFEVLTNKEQFSCIKHDHHDVLSESDNQIQQHKLVSINVSFTCKEGEKVEIFKDYEADSDMNSVSIATDMLNENKPLNKFDSKMNDASVAKEGAIAVLERNLDGINQESEQSGFVSAVESQESSFRSTFTNMDNQSEDQDLHIEGIYKAITDGCINTEFIESTNDNLQKCTSSVGSPTSSVEPMDVSYGNLETRFNYRDVLTMDATLITNVVFDEPSVLAVIEHSPSKNTQSCSRLVLNKTNENQLKMKTKSLLRPPKFNPPGMMGQIKLNKGAKQISRTPTTKNAFNSKLNSPASLTQETKIPKFPLTKKQQILTPRSETASSTSSQKKRDPLYFNVKSPIRTYIQSSSPVLITQVKSSQKEYSRTNPKKIKMSSEKKTLGTSHIPTSHRPTNVVQKLKYGNDAVNDERENVDPNYSRPSLLPVTYKSASSVFLKDNQDVQKKLPKLNEKFKKLLDTPKPKVIKHEGRTNVPPSEPGSLLSTPQLTNATTVTFDSSNNSLLSPYNNQGDISICATKTLFKTNALAK